MLGDAIYFWNTSMHVESVLFENLNWYAAKGILKPQHLQLAVIAVVLLAFIPLFRVVHPKRKKPNLPWSLLCLVMFAMGLNVAYALLAEGTYAPLTASAAWISRWTWKRPGNLPATALLIPLT